MDNDLGALVHAGGWEIDLATNALSWSPEVYRIHEVADDFFPTVERDIAFLRRGFPAGHHRGGRSGRHQGSSL